LVVTDCVWQWERTEGIPANGTQNHFQQLHHILVRRNLSTGVQRPHLRRQRGVHHLLIRKTWLKPALQKVPSIMP